MNIAELRLECLRLAVTNENGKNPIYQVKDAQRYLDWVMSPNITIELQAPAPDINVDPEYNAHLESLDTPERALRFNGWKQRAEGDSYYNERIFGAILPLTNGTWEFRGKENPSPIFWDKQKSFHRWIIEDVESRWDRTRCENHLNADGWVLSESFPFLPQFQKNGIATFWNGSQWGVRANIEKVTAPHFWDGNGSFPEWLASEITKLQIVQEGGTVAHEAPPTSSRLVASLILQNNFGWEQDKEDACKWRKKDLTISVIDSCNGKTSCMLTCKDLGSTKLDDCFFDFGKEAKLRDWLSQFEESEQEATPEQSDEIRQENAINFLKSILPYSEQLTGEVNHDNDTVDFFWRGYKYRFDPSKDEISLVVKSGDAIDNNASILMTALVRQAAKR